ncbi:MAG: ethanolamine utilization microcompartment protein EutL [Actinomycetales bacterium]|jgi:ethanolamine utilization protein EutL|nr:ethanolamine utilization microcompartment protein EutL [Candidatus Phosphoribacter baldrii]MBK6956883.1 ethanolamine utilization microcompartment protein EutL [Candidatus Phosphoribacter baldrii]MBK7611259.1 ethanolamine utilization microcompartment protein EutL [Candidatus Phosphoribacter baldrii]HRC17683.1 ethanolamine utilization microcompartment protein EutL [Phycicoccus elongatus]
MAVRSPIKASILATRIIPSVHPGLAQQFSLRPDQRSIAVITADIDDVLYASLDEATKKSDVEVVYAHSFYAGSAHASGPLSGEIIGVLAAPDPAEARAGLEACVAYATNVAWFESANEADSLTFFAHPISRTGTYLSKAAGVEPGTPLGYVIAPPLEATVALDAALKAAEVELAVWFAPPSETNFSGGYLIGDQSAVVAACQAFGDTVIAIAAAPREV